MMDPFVPITIAGDVDKPPVLFIHGFMGTLDDWRPVAEGLADRHHVLGINLPGHGSGWMDYPLDGLDMATCVQHIAAGLDAAGLDRLAIAGYSMGGRLALYVAAQYPERVSRLILESASPGLDSDDRREIRREQDEVLARRLEQLQRGSHGFHVFLEEWYALPLFETLQRDPDALARLVARRLETNSPALLAAALRALGTGSQPDLWPVLPSFRIPTLALAGEEDRKYRIIAEDMALACPAMAVEIMAGCGHNVHLENRDKFVTSVRAFLSPTARGNDRSP